MLVQHNIPLALADELTPHFCDVFSYSEIFLSKRTKTACIINGAIAQFFQKALVEIMKKEPFSIAVSDSGVEEMNPLTVRIFGGRIGSQFWICACHLHQLQKEFGQDV